VKPSLEELAAQVLLVLDAQQKYFASRDKNDLVNSRKLEAQLRRMAETALGKQHALPGF
jgi:hypothetical protein